MSGFTQVPNEVLEDIRLTVPARFLYILLLRNAWTHNQVFPGQKNLAERMKMSERSIRKYLRELIDHGLISSERRGLTKTNLYTLNKWITSNLEENNFPIKKSSKQQFKSGQHLPINNTKIKKTKSEGNRQHSQNFSIDEKISSYSGIIEVCEPQLRSISYATGVDFNDVQEVMKKMASYYSAEGKSFSNWPAKLANWVFKDLQDGKLERSYAVVQESKQEAARAKMNQAVASIFGDKWIEMPDLVDKVNSFISTTKGLETPLSELVHYLEFLKKRGIGAEMEKDKHLE